MFNISDAVIDSTALSADLRDAAAGAHVIFEGWVRNHNEGKAVDALEYEAYLVLAQTEGERILEEAADKFDILVSACVHRVGHLAIGDTAVWVGVSSAHRDAAFNANRYIIDEIKHRLPIWKKEHYVDGTAEWVSCQGCALHAHTHA